MPKRSQKNVPLGEQEGTHRKGSSGTIKSESGITHLHSSRQAPDISDPVSPVRRPSVGSMRVKHISPPCPPGSGAGQTVTEQIRFPKLEEYAHFHYDLVEIPSVKLSICGDETSSGYKHNPELSEDSGMFLVTVTGSTPKSWLIRRSLDNFATLDKQLHRCIFDRRFSHLEDLATAQLEVKSRQEVQAILQAYLSHFSELAGGMVNCGSVLSWMEMDNRGHRLVATDDSGINTPAIAAAHVIKRYNAQAADEISLQVGDMISVIDMPPAEDTVWWRGKRGFEVGFFPAECVEVIGDKVPTSVTSRFPEPVATAAAARRPCEISGQQTTSTTTTTTTTITMTNPITAAPSFSSSTTPSPSPSRSSTSTTSSSLGNFSVSSRGSSPPDTQPDQPVALTESMVMRKHGKLLSFLRTFFSHRPPRNQLKQSGIVKERVFGCDLGEHLLNSGHDVPLLLKSCTDIIEEYGIVHGIYRLSGITSNIQKLRLAFDEDRVPDLTEDCYLQDIHSISSLLKMYFRELPNPLLTYQLYDKFADAVRDEDNKLLKIHDVVQQLPPPHYRTTEYLMRHLARVAAFGHETEMHSKNLAIVWAPNLLRSKELEAGGGAAALQGVGIQAVVTECLICYCDIIFSDKMPNYGSQDSGKGQKKPRPKSLAISTPTRLLSLEEARERAFIGHLAPKKFIDVGGGPKNLPSKYHTVIDLPGYRKKVSNSTKENKKAATTATATTATGGSGSGGRWKSIFSKPRSGSVKKPRKNVMQDSVTLGPAQAKALTEEDVHNWKRHLRSAKSAESLFSLTHTTSSRSSVSSRTSHSNMDNIASGNRQDSNTGRGPAHIMTHKRSLSSDASAVLQHHFFSHDASESPQPIDVDDQDGESGRQSFIRGDSTRKALHRRVPSAPNTPRQDRKSHSERSVSMTRGEVTSGSDEMDISFDDFVYPKSEKRGDVNIDVAIKSRLLQVAEKNRSAKSNEELTSSPLKRSAKTPPQGRKKAKGAGQAHIGSSEDELSPSMARPSARKVTRSSSDISSKTDTSPYDNDDRESRMRRFYSRFHDYAEIVSDEDAPVASTPGSQGTMSVSSSGCNMQDVLDQIDTRLAMNAQLFPRPGLGETSSYRVGESTHRSPPNSKETVFPVGAETTTTTTTGISPKTGVRETEFSVTGSPPLSSTTKSASLPRETEFPATCNTAPHDASNHATMRQVQGADASLQEGQGQNSGSDRIIRHDHRASMAGQEMAGATQVGRRRAEMGAGNKPPPSQSSQFHRAGDKSGNSATNSTRVMRRHAEFIPSSNASAKDLQNLHELLDSLEKQSQPDPRAKTRSLPPTHSSGHPGSQSSHSQHPRQHHHHRRSDRSPQHQSPPQASVSPSLDSNVVEQREQGRHTAPPGDPSAMSKCLSIPSDIARSLEDVTASQCDMLSSVTISELSMSVNSFSNGVGEDGITPTAGPSESDPRRRRSTSLDSLADSDRLMTRTLREINRQMDAAFKHESGNISGSDVGLESFAGYQRRVASDLDLSTSPGVKLKPQPFFDARTGAGARAKPENTEDEVVTGAQMSNQNVTPTQPTSDAFTPTTQYPPHPSRPQDLPPRPSLSSSRLSDSGSPSESDVDDSFTYVTGRTSSASLGNVPTPSASTEDPMTTLSRSGDTSVNCSSGASSALTNVTPEVQPDSLHRHHQQQQQQQRLRLSPQHEVKQTQGRQAGRGAAGMDRQREAGVEKQTHRQKDDHILVQVPHVVKSQQQGTKALAVDPRTEHQATTAHHHHHHHHHHHRHPQHDQDGVKGRSDIACVRRNKLSSSSSSSSDSSSSSEEFDQVASPEEDEEDVRTDNSRRNMTLPVGAAAEAWGDNLEGRRNPEALTVNVPTGDISPYQVVLRQHSPRVEQRSPRSPRGGPRSPRFDLGAVGSYDNMEISGDASNLHWQSNSLFPDGHRLEDGEASERMSSLCAAGLVSQRARLSRESSTSSLQSPDNSYSNIPAGNPRSPLATPVREALPDLIQSTTPQMGGQSAETQTRSNVPLQLALYHPDEFSMDIPASVSGHAAPPPRRPVIHPSPSLPQVHSSPDTVLVKKPTLRKSSTDNSIKSAAEGFSPDMISRNFGVSDHPRAAQNDHRIISGNLRLVASLSMDSGQSQAVGNTGVDSECFRPRTASDSHTLHSTDQAVQRTQQGLGKSDMSAGKKKVEGNAAAAGGVCGAQESQQQRQRQLVAQKKSSQDADDQVAMEIDNLCNKLVDDLTSPSQAEPPASFPQEDAGSLVVCASRDVRTDMDEQGTMSMEVETSLEVKGSEPMSPVIQERRVVRSSSGEGQNQETRIVRVQNSTGGMEEEEVQNVLNQGREMLMSPELKEGASRRDKSSSAKAGTSVISHEPSGASALTDPFVPARKSSFSKIPRPKQITDVASPKSSSGSRRGESSSVSADTSPSSSSSSTSSSSRGGHVRRGSESSGVATGKRPGHLRRSSDTKLTDLRTTSPTSRPNSASARSDSGRGVTSPRGRGPDSRTGSSDNTSSKTSRIPLSHRMPSPQQSDKAGGEGSNLGVTKPQSKIPSPIPKPRKLSASSRGAENIRSRADQTAPTTDDVIEVNRQSVRREPTNASHGSKEKCGGASAGSKEKSGAKETGCKKTVVVRDMQDRGGAKLVIETQPELKKKIQTVHAKKVSQPPRQVAEAVNSDSMSEVKLATNVHTKESSDPPPTVTFSDNIENQTDTQIKKETGPKKTPPPVAKRKFHYDSRSLPRRGRQLNAQVSLSEQQANGEQYTDLVGSRSSLDDSVLQLAAERHDLWVPEEVAGVRNYSSCTGSLRARRSQKMQSLVDLFERGSDSNMSDSSGSSPGTRHRDRTFSGSVLGQAGQLTPCMEVGGRGDLEVNDDDPFLPPIPPSLDRVGPTPRERGRSGSRERFPSRAGTEASQWCSNKENVGDRQTSASCDRAEETAAPGGSRQQGKRSSNSEKFPESCDLRQRPVSPARRPAVADRRNRHQQVTSAPATSPDLSAVSTSSRPPRYRSNSKSRTHSESSASESDTTTHPGEISTVRFATGQQSHSPCMSASYTAHSGNDLFSQHFPDSVLKDTQQTPVLRRQLSDSRTGQLPDGQLVARNRQSDSHKDKLDSNKTQTSAGSGANASCTPPPSPKKASEGRERRNSIKELRQVFERPDWDLLSSEQELPSPTDPSQTPTVRSISPQPDPGAERRRERVSVMRLSMELGSSTDSASSEVKSQPLRLGPKPFYGTQK